MDGSHGQFAEKAHQPKGGLQSRKSLGGDKPERITRPPHNDAFRLAAHTNVEEVCMRFALSHAFGNG